MRKPEDLVLGIMVWSGVSSGHRIVRGSLPMAVHPVCPYDVLQGHHSWQVPRDGTAVRTTQACARRGIPLISRSSRPGWLPRSGPPRARARMRADARLRAPAAHPGAASERCKLCCRASPGRGRGSAAKAHHGAVAASAGHAQVVDPALGGPRRVAAVVAKAARLWPQARDHPALSRVYTYLCAHG